MSFLNTQLAKNMTSRSFYDITNLQKNYKNRSFLNMQLAKKHVIIIIFMTS